MCGEANGAAVADATAVDIVATKEKENVEKPAIREPGGRGKGGVQALLVK